MTVSEPFVFFDLGQTLVDEWKFIEYFDSKFLDFLNGFGARIDPRNYQTVRDSVIRDRRIGFGSVKELVEEVSSLLAPAGYDKVIASRIAPEVAAGIKEFFKFADDAPLLLQTLDRMGIGMGLIANQSNDILQLLAESGLEKYFSVNIISSVAGLSKPDARIFELALQKAGRAAGDCIMVGDRLDTDICPAKTAGMKTIRYTNSLFSLQEPQRDCEYADYVVSRLQEIPPIVKGLVRFHGKQG